jgi:hypothetical protein
MIMDANLVICESMSIAAAAAGHVHGTNVIYLPQGKDHKGVAAHSRYNVSGKLYWNVLVEDEDMLAAADGSVVTFYLYGGAVETNPLVDNSGTVIDSVAITENTPTEHPDGTLLFSRAIPQGQLDEYFDMYVTVGTQNLSTGKVTAWIGGPVQQGT